MFYKLPKQRASGPSQKGPLLEADLIARGGGGGQCRTISAVIAHLGTRLHSNKLHGLDFELS